MSPIQVALVTVFGTILLLVAIAAKAFLFWEQRKQILSLGSILGRMEKSAEDARALLKSAVEISNGMAGAAVTLAESSQMQVIQLEAVAKSVTVLRRTLLTGQTDEETYDERQVQSEMEVEQLIEKGITRSEAEKRVAEKDVWERFKLGR